MHYLPLVIWNLVRLRRVLLRRQRQPPPRRRRPAPLLRPLLRRRLVPLQLPLKNRLLHQVAPLVPQVRLLHLHQLLLPPRQHHRLRVQLQRRRRLRVLQHQQHLFP